MGVSHDRCHDCEQGQAQAQGRAPWPWRGHGRGMGVAVPATVSVSVTVPWSRTVSVNVRTRFAIASEYAPDTLGQMGAYPTLVLGQLLGSRRPACNLLHKTRIIAHINTRKQLVNGRHPIVANLLLPRGAFC